MSFNIPFCSVKLLSIEIILEHNIIFCILVAACIKLICCIRCRCWLYSSFLYCYIYYSFLFLIKFAYYTDLCFTGFDSLNNTI